MATFWQDNFEAGSLEMWRDRSVSAGGTFAISTDQAHSGTQSLKSEIDDAGETASGFNLTNGVVIDEWYARFWIYIPSATIATMSDGDFFTCFALLDDIGGALTTFIIQHTGGSVKCFMVYDSSNAALLSTSTITADTWHNIEGFIKLGASEDAKLWINGALEDSDIGVNTNGNSNSDLKVILIGLEATGGMTGAIYLDDFVIDLDKHIGTGFRVTQDGAIGSPIHN